MHFAEIARWKRRLDEKPHRAKKLLHAKNFYIMIAVSTLVGMLINFAGNNPMSALFWTAVLNGYVAPPLLLLPMLVSNNPKVMGNRVNGRLVNFLRGFTTLAMFAAAIGLILTW